MAESRAELQAQYDDLATQVLRLGTWLTGPRGLRLPRSEWEAAYGRYGKMLERLRDISDRLRPPVAARTYREPTGDALVSEVLALFAE